MKIGFTSSRSLSPAQQKFIVASLESLVAQVPQADGWVTGACVGGDALIGRTLARLRPNDTHIILVPADRSRVAYWWDSLEFQRVVINMPAGTTYKDRNSCIVYHSDAVVGYPQFPEKDPRSLRSGTWQTIRMAQAANLKTVVKVLHK